MPPADLAPYPGRWERLFLLLVRRDPPVAAASAFAARRAARRNALRAAAAPSLLAIRSAARHVVKLQRTRFSRALAEQRAAREAAEAARAAAEAALCATQRELDAALGTVAAQRHSLEEMEKRCMTAAQKQDVAERGRKAAHATCGLQLTELRLLREQVAAAKADQQGAALEAGEAAAKLQMALTQAATAQRRAAKAEKRAAGA